MIFSKSDTLVFFLNLFPKEIFIIKQMSHIQRFIVDGHFGFSKKKYTPLENHFMSNYRMQIV